MTLSPRTAELRNRLVDLCMKQLDWIEAGLRPPEEALDNPSGTALLREASDIACLWRVCEKSACLRSRRCRRARGHCLAHFAPRIPPATRAYMIATLRSRHAEKCRQRIANWP